MKVGILNTALNCDTMEEAFAMASSAGADGVEVQYTRANKKLLRQADHARELNELAAKHQLEIPSLCLAYLCDKATLVGTPKDIAAAQKSICHALRLAGKVGAAMVVVPFFANNAINVEDELARATDALMELVDEAENASVTIAVESTLNFDQQCFLLTSLGETDDTRIYCDTGNALARKLDPAGGIRQLGINRIAQIHYKDVRLTEGSPPDFDLPLGGGEVDFRAVTEALRAIGYDKWIVLETPPGDDPAASAAANLAFVRQLLG